MVMLKENITVNLDILSVFDYVSDFTTIEQWDPGVKKSRKVTPGPTGVGTRYELTLSYGMIPVSMSYEITVFDRPTRVVLLGRGDSFSAIDTITFGSEGTKTRIDYQADLKFQGMGATIAPIFKPLLTRIGKQAVAGLEKAFDGKIQPPKAKPFTRLLDKTVIGGLPAFTRFGYSSNKKKWRPVTGSASGKTIVITGPTSGIGFATACDLSHRGARIVMVARNMKKADDARQRITAWTGNDDIAVYPADMGDVHQVRQVAEDILKNESTDVLINNAGALYTTRQVTSSGLERTFATDLLGPFVLTEMLIPGLASSDDPRIINVSSGGMYTQGIHVDDLHYLKEAYDGSKAYARAKRGLVILTELWAERLKSRGITVHAMHPGWVRTPGVEKSLPFFYRLMDRFLRTPQEGADTIVWLSTAPAKEIGTGLFWLDRIPRTTHVFKSTKETPGQREELYRQLALIMEGLP